MPTQQRKDSIWRNSSDNAFSHCTTCNQRSLGEKLANPSAVIWLHLRDPVRRLKFSYILLPHRPATSIYFPTNAWCGEQNPTRQKLCLQICPNHLNLFGFNVLSSELFTMFYQEYECKGVQMSKVLAQMPWVATSLGRMARSTYCCLSIRLFVNNQIPSRQHKCLRLAGHSVCHCFGR